MVNINALNFPLALATIIFRKLIDLHNRKMPLRAMSRNWLADDLFNPNILFIYMIGAACTYLGSHIRRGALGVMANKCSKTALTFRDKYVLKRRWLKRNRSWILKSLLNTKDNQKKAMAYLSIATADASSAVPGPVVASQPPAIPAQPTVTLYTNTVPTTQQAILTDYREKGDSTERGDLNKTPNEEEVRNIQESMEVDDYPSDGSELGVYTPSVIREIIPSDCSDECPDLFKTPCVIKKKRGRPKKDSSKTTFVKKTRSGRIY